MAGLLSPLAVGDLLMKNRIVMAPMATNMATPKGVVTPRLIEHYSKRANAGVGLIIIEHTYVMASGRHSPRQLGAYDDSQVPGLGELTAAMHKTETPVILQITHAGRRTSAKVLGDKPVAPSNIPDSPNQPPPRALDETELTPIIEAFVKAAGRAKEAGFDGVEIHGAHGFLLSSFLSPASNRRQDSYGGTFENRLRLPLEVVVKVRERVGPDYPILYRLGAEDHVPSGLTLAESTTAAQILVSKGVNILDISGGLCGSRPPNLATPGFFVPAAETIKKTVAPVPVIGVGGIKDPSFADSLVKAGRIDLVAVGRALLTDPNWALKAAQELASSQ